MTDFLSVTERGTSQPVVTRYVGMYNRTVLSAGFGSAIGSDGNTIHSFRNMAVAVTDERIICVLNDGLYESTDSGATFSLLQAFADPGTASVDDKLCHGGIHEVYVGGVENTMYLAGMYRGQTVGQLFGWRYRLSDGSYDETAGPTLGLSADFVQCEFLYGSTIVINGTLGGTNGNFYHFDVVARNWQTNPIPFGGTWGSVAFAIAPDRHLYAFGFNTLLRLLMFDSGWTHMADLESGAAVDGNTNNNRAQSRPELFSDGTDLYAIYLDSNAGGTSHGFHVTRIPAPYDGTGESQVGSAVLPLSLINTDEGGTATNNATKRVFVVQDDSSGSLVTYLLFSLDNVASSQLHAYQWNGPATPLTFLGSGGAVRDSIPTNTKLGGGGYFYSAGGVRARIVSVSPTTSGETVSFVCYGGGTLDVSFLVGRNGQSPAATATLSSPVTGGGVLVGNTVTGCAADGATVHTVKWDFASDSVADGEGLVALVASPA